MVAPAADFLAILRALAAHRVDHIVVGGHGFDALVGHTKVVEVSGIAVEILDLPTLIRVKEETSRAKDLLSLQILRRLLQEGEGR